MLISVLFSDIDKGLLPDEECPIKLAIMRATSWPKHYFAVGPEAVTIWSPRKSVPLPKSAKRFLSRFDSEREVGAFEFEVPL